MKDDIDEIFAMKKSVWIKDLLHSLECYMENHGNPEFDNDEEFSEEFECLDPQIMVPGMDAAPGDHASIASLALHPPGTWSHFNRF
jgi:hypothetical protein